ncbi:MAG: pyridoxal phosphate-dependent aminotransferase [Bacteroidales bacterium]|jgi:aspartate aminotransferase|nr:pyridoxal phosphate-dependent aminotransferase [Bacteroidales bacterium]
MEKVSFRIRKMQESATLKMTQISRELKNKGIDIISLSIGEPDFNTPDFVKEAAIEAINNNITKYPPVAGYESLQIAICKKLKEENNLSFDPKQIVVSTGAKHSLMNVILSIVDRGDEVIIPAPYWVSYSEMVEFAEGTPVFVNCSSEQNFKITPQQLKEAITPYTRAFLLNSPSNPTGMLYTKNELKALTDILENYPNITIISDEIYEYINFIGKHESIAQFENIKDRVVVINGVSKGYAMTGWRIGYMAGPLYIAKAVTKLQGQFTSGACSIAQKTAEAALLGSENEKKIISKMTNTFKNRRDLVYSLLDIPGLNTKRPDGAFYFFPDISNFLGKSYHGTIINNSDELAMSLLLNEHVATVGGDAFGAPNCLRLSYATDEQSLKTALKRMRKYFSEII